MKYLARRLTGDREWLHADLPLTKVERTRTLSGPGSISATIEPELRELFAEDGRRIIEDWGTMIYAVDDEHPDSPIVAHGIVAPPQNWVEAATTLTCVGVAGYPQGMIYDGTRNWGPATDPRYPLLPRPDPLQIVQDLWAHLQSRPDSNLGVVITGDLASSVRIGSNEEPYRLRYWEAVDIGGEIDNLVQSTPFDYVEETWWADAAHSDVTHTVRLGWPRLGTRRTDLRFVLGENIIESVPVDTLAAYANDVIGIGNGEGRTMKMARSTVRDGRLRRMAVVTDKTLGQYALNRLTVSVRERVAAPVSISEIKVKEHPNASLAKIQPGDDVFVQTHVDAHGPIREWHRVMAITEQEHTDEATLSLQWSGAFLYSPTTDVAL